MVEQFQVGSFPVGCSTGAGCVNCLQRFRAGAMGPERWCKARRGTASASQRDRQRGRHTDMGKLDPEREMAGGKVLVLLPRLQVRQHPSDWPQNHKHAHMVTFREAKGQPGTHSHSHKQMYACRATHKCHERTARLWLSLRDVIFPSVHFLGSDYVDAEADLFTRIRTVDWSLSTAPFNAVQPWILLLTLRGRAGAFSSCTRAEAGYTSSSQGWVVTLLKGPLAVLWHLSCYQHTFQEEPGSRRSAQSLDRLSSRRQTNIWFGK